MQIRGASIGTDFPTSFSSTYVIPVVQLRPTRPSDLFSYGSVLVGNYFSTITTIPFAIVVFRSPSETINYGAFLLLPRLIIVEVTRDTDPVASEFFVFVVYIFLLLYWDRE